MRRIVLGVLPVLVAISPLMAQGPGSPSARWEERAVGLFRVLKAGEPDAVVSYLRDNLTDASWNARDAGEWRRLAERLVARVQPLSMGGVSIMQPNRLTLELGTMRQAGPGVSLLFEFERREPYQIESLGVEVGGGPDRGPALPALELSAGASPEVLASSLAHWVGDLAARDLFSGTVLVARGGDVLFSAAHGLASQRFGVSNKRDTRFDLGSINKAFTKIAVGQLLERGRLSLDDKLIDHVPDYPDAEVAARVTVRQLLDHTSGLGDMFTERFRLSSRALYREPRDYFPLFAGEPLLFEPGTGEQYSNAGYIVLGAVIEAVSGEAYDQYINAHVFQPAGMTQSGFFERDAIVPNVAEGYTRWIGDGPGDARRSNVLHLPVKGNPAGSAQSTVDDLLRFDAALREHRLLSPRYTKWFFEGELPRQGVDSSERARGHLGIAGGGPGVSAILESDGEITVAVLSNYDPPLAERIGIAIFRALRTQ